VWINKSDERLPRGCDGTGHNDVDKNREIGGTVTASNKKMLFRVVFSGASKSWKSNAASAPPPSSWLSSRARVFRLIQYVRQIWIGEARARGEAYQAYNFLK
jgi:hypothetical protein